MKEKSRQLLIALTLFLLLNSARAEGYVTHLYHVNLNLTENRLVDCYFFVVDFPQNKEFRNQNELKAFLIQKTKNEAGEIDKLYKEIFRILDFPSVDNWIRGQIVISKCEPLIVAEKEILNVELISSDEVPSRSIHDFTEQDINYLTQEPEYLIPLALDEDITVVGDGYLTYLLISYNKSNNVDLKKLKTEIESEYFLESKNSNKMEKFKIWKKVFVKYKEELQKVNIVFITISEF